MRACRRCRCENAESFGKGHFSRLPLARSRDLHGAFSARQEESAPLALSALGIESQQTPSSKRAHVHPHPETPYATGEKGGCFRRYFTMRTEYRSFKVLVSLMMRCGISTASRHARPFHPQSACSVCSYPAASRSQSIHPHASRHHHKSSRKERRSHKSKARAVCNNDTRPNKSKIKPA